MRKLLFIVFVLIGYQGFSQTDKDIQTISSIINQQQDAWNKADLEAFMHPYWHSDSLTFIGKNGIKRGWQTTLDNYKKGYPNAETMGKLAFTIISTEKLADNAVFVVGKWVN